MSTLARLSESLGKLVKFAYRHDDTRRDRLKNSAFIYRVKQQFTLNSNKGYFFKGTGYTSCKGPQINEKLDKKIAKSN